MTEIAQGTTDAPEIVVRQVSGLHVAHLEPLSGFGFLVCPAPSSDLWLSGSLSGSSLNGADYDSAIRTLRAMGWEPLTEDDGVLIAEGSTANGAPVLALIAAEPVINEPSIEDLSRARQALVHSAGLAH